MNKRNAGTLTDAAERAEYVGLMKQLRNEDFGAHLKRLLGHGPPDDMVRAHAHHILFKTGLGHAQRQLVAEGMEILLRHGIDPIYGFKNLVWAPNIAGQHTTPALKRVLDALRKADANGANAVHKALDYLGSLAAGLG